MRAALTRFAPDDASPRREQIDLPPRGEVKRSLMAPPQSSHPASQISFRCIAPAMWSAWRIASDTMVRVGLQSAPVVNWLPSETNRFLTSWVWPNLLTTPSLAFALIRLVPMLWVEG